MANEWQISTSYPRGLSGKLSVDVWALKTTGLQNLCGAMKMFRVGSTPTPSRQRKSLVFCLCTNIHDEAFLVKICYTGATRGVTAPNIAIWSEDGWVVENVGVPPDSEVEQCPAEVIQGHDPQLEKAIDVILEELEQNPPKKLKRPPYPVRVKKK